MRGMHWTFTCVCGRAFATRSQDELVATAQRHIVALHAVALPPSRRAVLELAQPIGHRRLTATDQGAPAHMPLG